MYLRGRYFWNNRTKESLNRAIDYFQQAIELDPNYALAYAGLSDSHSLLGYYSYAPRKESQASAEAAALKALALDDELAEAHASLGNLKLQKWDWLNAERELKRAQLKQGLASNETDPAISAALAYANDRLGK